MAKAKKSGGKPKADSRAPANGSDALEELKKIYGFMQANGLQSVELDRKDLHLRLVRKSRAAVPVPVPVYAGAAPGGGAAPAPSPAQRSPEPAPANAALVRSPMMGIFYRAASPSSPPFCKEGDTVKPGDVVCLIEAMKVFNDVKSEFGGIVRRVCVENGKSVKVGQELFVLEPN